MGKLPANIILSGTSEQEPQNYVLVEDKYVSEGGDIFPVEHLDDLIADCLLHQRSFVLVYSDKKTRLH